MSTTSRPHRSPSVLIAALLALVALVAACGAGGATGTPAPSPTPGGTLTQDEAVALVLAQDPQFAGIGPLDPNLIGQSAWYEVGPGTVGWRVTVTKGWGDCQAGCINRHTWTYDVEADGTVTLVGETGDPVADGVDGEGGGAAGTPPVSIPPTGGPWIAGLAAAGPVCPVEQVPPDPACAARPVAGAVVVVRDASGAQVAEATTAADGSFLAAVPGGGTYTVEAQPVEGLMGTPAPVVVEVEGAPSAWATVSLPYDTGIR